MMRILLLTVLALALLLPARELPAQIALGDDFTYQGFLRESGDPANGNFDLEFRLFDNLLAGNELGTSITLDNVGVKDGFFTVILDFGEETEEGDLIFSGDKRWLQIGVRAGADTGAFTPLLPRQQLRAAPYAIFAIEAEIAQELEGGSNPDSGLTAEDFWQLGGNGLFAPPPGVNLLGSTNAQPLELWVGGMRVWRLERPGGPVNVIGGSDGNEVAAGAFGCTISGGGSNTGNPTLINRVTDNLGTVSGGSGNRAGDGDGDMSNAYYATVGGGFQNVASGPGAIVGGGSGNVASGFAATVGGGSDNVASEMGATIAGGDQNVADGVNATVPGGAFNKAQGASSFAGGFKAEALHNGAFVWNATPSDAHPVLRSTGMHQFLVGAGEVWFGNGTVAPSFPGYLNTWTGGYLSGGGMWTNSSDENSKENFVEVNGGELLERLARLPIRTWNYKDEEPSVRHIGPTSQDFSAAFDVGADDQHIGTVDADGVALATVKALHELVKQQDVQIKALTARLEALEQAAQGRELSPVDAPPPEVSQGGAGR